MFILQDYTKHTSVTRFLLAICFTLNFIYAQVIYIGKEKSTIVHFYSDAPLEKIEAKHTQSIPVFNISNGDFQIRLKMQAFQFKNDLMKEHFNENYVESDKYPYCTFKGKSNLVQFQEGKEHTVTIQGIMDLHGVEKNINVTGIIKKIGNEIIMEAEFYLKPADYNIKIPTLLTKKIAEEVKVTFKSTLVPYEPKQQE
jgi:polyisoprenoid-binding protein YceI